jgi:hypothetical protein
MLATLGVVAAAACVTPTSLSAVTCDASALRGVLARVPLPHHGLELVVADSRIPGAGRGLFACTTTTEAQLLPWGTPLCGLAVGTWHAQASGDSAVPFEFTDAGQLVLHAGELAPLEVRLDAQHAHVRRLPDTYGHPLCHRSDRFVSVRTRACTRTECCGTDRQASKL